MSKSQRKNITTHKILIKILIIFFVLNFLIVALLSSVFSQTYDISKYDERFEKFSVYDRFEKQTALEKTQNILDFFDSKSDLDKDFFYGKEISHLQDVKLLLYRAKNIYFAFLFFMLIILLSFSYLNKENYLSILVKLSLYSGVFLLFFLFITVLLYQSQNFNFLFQRFHEMFFTGNYAFNPDISNMKALFPDILFFDIAKSIFLELLSVSLLFTLIGIISRKKIN